MVWFFVLMFDDFFSLLHYVEIIRSWGRIFISVNCQLGQYIFLKQKPGQGYFLTTNKTHPSCISNDLLRSGFWHDQLLPAVMGYNPPFIDYRHHSIIVSLPERVP